MSLSFVLWSMSSFNNQNFLICGKTVGSCRRNVIKPLKQMLIARGYRLKDRRTENILTVSRNDKSNDYYVFGGKDESSQDLIQGITAAGLFCDEVALMPQSFVNQATARCSVDGSKWWFNCNPAGPNHWFKKEWIDKAKERNILYQHFTLNDNLSLSERIKERLRQQYEGVFYQRYILGRWALAEGLIYPMYQQAIAEPPKTAIFDDYCISIDYGTENAFAALKWAHNAADNVWYCIDEYYYSGRNKGIQKTDEEYGNDLDRFTADITAEREKRLKDQLRQGMTDPDFNKLEVIIDPSAASFIALLKKKKWYRVRKANNGVLDGIRDTASAMKTGRIKISSKCKCFINELGGYVWDTKAVDAGIDKPLKVDDHACDAGRYFVYTKHIMRRNKEHVDLSGLIKGAGF